MDKELKFYKASNTSSLPVETEDGAVYYVTESNQFFIDMDGHRGQVNASADWQTENANSPTFIANKPDLGTASAKNVANSLDNSDDLPTSGQVLDAINDASQDITDEINVLMDTLGYARYGVSGIGQQASTLTRLYDAIGMVAEVGTDGDNSNVRNDFDRAIPFARRKCVGHWELGETGAKFIVQAYLGDPAYTEDGSMGDYVAVECPRCYYSFNHDTGTLVISAHQYEGYRAFDIFCRNHNQADTVPYYYAPAYALAMKDGHAVSLPGLDNEQGAYKTLVDAVKTYNGEASEFAMLVPASWNFYEWALFTVEFATQNCQSIMQGCCNLRSADSEVCKFIDETHAVIPYNGARVPGEYIAITTATSHTNPNYKATHKLVSLNRCNEDGTLNTSGTYSLIEVEDLGKTYFTYEIGTNYYIAGRPYRTGSCNGVSTPSGSPVNNTSGYYPCKYRWHENPYSNQYYTTADLFNVREGTGDSDYYLEWYYLLKPWEYVPSSASKPDKTDLSEDKFVKLGVSTPHERYVNGYVKSKEYDAQYPDIWIPGLTTGATTSTYFCDYTSLVNSPVVRSVRLGGYWPNGGYAGFSNAYAFSAPSSVYAYSGSALFVSNWG